MTPHGGGRRYAPEGEKMSQIVQARCPFCQNVLRIPAEWIGQPMRCKHCQQVMVQARTKTPLPAARPANAVAAAPVSAVPVSSAPVRPAVGVLAGAPPVSRGDPFSFAGDGPIVRPRRRPGARWWIGVLVLAAVAGVGATVFA